MIKYIENKIQDNGYFLNPEDRELRQDAEEY